MRGWMLLLAVVAAGCTGGRAIEAIGRLDGELAAARGKRRVVALVSPS